MLALGLRASLLAGILTVALLEFPIMCRAIDEVMRLGPPRAQGGFGRARGDPVRDGPEGRGPPDRAGHPDGRPARLRPRHRRRRLGPVHGRLHRPRPGFPGGPGGDPAAGHLLPAGDPVPRGPAEGLRLGRGPDPDHPSHQPGRPGDEPKGRPPCRQVKDGTRP
ncbi:MAG: hypothetical protein MZU91_07800 [Desulfosudis oleivorans]|nr:hypothetical protein [Desulfosudis oleivorans]